MKYLAKFGLWVGRIVGTFLFGYRSAMVQFPKPKKVVGAEGNKRA